MGAKESIDYNKIPLDWLEVFDKMKLTRSEVKKIHEIFEKIDVKQKRGITIVEWLTFLDLERNSFTERIFSAFDKDGNKLIDFYEFVVSLWKFCTLAEGSISIFAFDLYDKNADGYLEVKEVSTLFKELLGARSFETDTTKASLNELTTLTESGNVGIDDFRLFSRTHQALMQQVFLVQTRMRDRILGNSFWKSFAKRHIELRKGYNVPIGNLMTLHSDRPLFKSLLEDRTIMRISSKMRIVLENTDNSLHYRTPDISMDSAKAAAARVVMYKPASAKKSKRHKTSQKVTPTADPIHYHRFPV